MEIIIRSLVMFIVLFLIVKVLGSKQIKKLTLYDYILSITIGSIAADSIISTDIPIYEGILALVLFGVIGYISSYLSYHNHKVEEMIDGEPLILYENDDFNLKNLEASKLSVAKILESCRLKGCFDINDLECAILEPSGDISILLKEKAQPLTCNDIKGTMKKNSQKQKLSHLIIVDGMLNEMELKKAKKDYNWLTKYLKQKNLTIETVLLLAIDKNNKIALYNK